MRRFWPLSLLLFWTGWMGELKALFARSAAVRAPGYKACCEIHLGDGGLEITELSRGRDGDRRKLIGIVTPGNSEALPRLLGRRNLPVILTLPVEKCFLHRVEVPKLALARIDQLLGLELARVTPFSANDVLTGWHEAEGSSATHAVVSQVVAKRSLIDPVLAELARWKVPVMAIFARSDATDYVPARLANPAVAIGDPATARWRQCAIAACALACLSALATAWSLFGRQASALDELTARIEVAQKQALAVRERLAQMESSSQRIVDLKRAKTDGPSPLAIWEELTHLLPDTAWVSALTIEKAQVTIEGNARSPEELIPLLDGSPLFDSVSFAAPVTKLPGNDMTRFVIRLSLTHDLHLSSAAP